ncbi:uncharacterized protein LOC127809808 [Diospyros lotus]|uniref:uncharacterized protein LOC127809808 n=1 Tax=Diospyros lotus TaxID=55363 RepID=UPI00224E6C4C|nr:uncharacterized protein LOC127809808 [Diospyros lotus]
MAKLNGLQGINTAHTPETPRGHTHQSLDQVLQAHSSSVLGEDHDYEDCHVQNNKKSVLTKVKEKDQKLQQSLSSKKNGNEDSGASPGVPLDEGADGENPEYLGAPMYESEMAPEPYKEMARQHPRSNPVISEDHEPNNMKCEAEQDQEKPPSQTKTLTETVSETLVPAYAAIASKIASLTVAAPTSPDTAEHAGKSTVPETREHVTDGQQTRGTGVLPKEQLKHTPGDVGLGENARGAATSLRNNEEPFKSTTRAASGSPSLPNSTDPQVAEEESRGRILKAN